MVHFPGFARSQLCIHWDVLEFYPSGFPHSEIPGSMPACGSPRLIAACHVLHRLLLPRHPPCALSSLTTKFTRHTAALLHPAQQFSLSFRFHPAQQFPLQCVQLPLSFRLIRHNNFRCNACNFHCHSEQSEESAFLAIRKHPIEPLHAA
jgi:hypothetical protein